MQGKLYKRATLHENYNFSMDAILCANAMCGVGAYFFVVSCSLSKIGVLCVRPLCARLVKLNLSRTSTSSSRPGDHMMITAQRGERLCGNQGRFGLPDGKELDYMQCVCV